MSFTNLYYKRTTGTARPCFICYKPSTTCLATQNTVDFLYTCDAHLTDPGFASRIVDPAAAKPVLSAAELAEIKADWEERQKRKAEKEKDKSDKDNKDKDDKDAKSDAKDKAKSPTISPTPTPKSETPKPTHERYTLHRDMFALRQAEHRKRRQTAAAKSLAPQLPSAPRGGV